MKSIQACPLKLKKTSSFNHTSRKCLYRWLDDSIVDTCQDSNTTPHTMKQIIKHYMTQPTTQHRPTLIERYVGQTYRVHDFSQGCGAVRPSNLRIIKITTKHGDGVIHRNESWVLSTLPIAQPLQHHHLPAGILLILLLIIKDFLKIRKDELRLTDIMKSNRTLMIATDNFLIE